jgi:uncharacterized membrane protein
MKNIKEQHDVWMTTKRIETLVDGVFAIALTLLVLNIDLPQITGKVTDPLLWQYLINLSQELFIYGFSFLLLASFWRAHHQQFFYIKRSDSNLIWLNVIWLMFVALVPFSTNFVSNYGSHMLAMLFFNINMLLIGLFFIFNWSYAKRKNYFIDGMTSEHYKVVRKIDYILPIAAMLAIAITFVSPLWSPICYFSIFIFKGLFKRGKL